MQVHRMQGLGATKSRLRNLLKYTDELLSFNEKVAFDLAREPYPHFHEFQVAGLEGVEVGFSNIEASGEVTKLVIWSTATPRSWRTGKHRSRVGSRRGRQGPRSRSRRRTRNRW